jgi:cation diffusion facilitator CzcD-associated flavoprotein CzcO
LIIATGIFNLPYIPEIDGLKNFKGRMIHSGSYRSGETYKGKKVLVVGGSLTAVELAANISKYA